MGTKILLSFKKKISFDFDNFNSVILNINKKNWIFIQRL